MVAREARTFTITTPPGTLPANRLVSSLAMPPRIVRTVQVVVPPGPNGNLGFAFGAAGQPVIPYNANAWIITSDEKLSWDIDGQISSGAWQLFTYNTGLFAHTLYIRFLLDLVTDAAPDQPPAFIPSASLDSLTADDLAALAGDPLDALTPPGTL